MKYVLIFCQNIIVQYHSPVYEIQFHVVFFNFRVCPLKTKRNFKDFLYRGR